MDPNNQNAKNTMQIKKPRRINSKKLIIIILALLLLAAVGTVGYLYWIERENSSRLQAQLHQQKAAPKKKIDDKEPAPAQAKYSATVGKFTLTLGQLYYIIVDLDGNFEGGPATRLAVGTRNDTGEQTISSPNHARVTVDAYPTSSSSYDERVTSETKDFTDQQKLASVKVDGVDAEVYQLDGLFTDKKLFFTKNDIVYVITAGSSDATGGIIDAVIKGFKFN